jgi:hypothetical protein
MRLSGAARYSCRSETTADAGAHRSLGALLPTAITRVHCVCPRGAADTGVLRALLMLAAGRAVAELARSGAGRDEPRGFRTPGLGALVTGDSDVGRDAGRMGVHRRGAVLFAEGGGVATVGCAVAGAVRVTGIGMTKPGLFWRRTCAALRCKGSSGASGA